MIIVDLELESDYDEDEVIRRLCKHGCPTVCKGRLGCPETEDEHHIFVKCSEYVDDYGYRQERVYMLPPKLSNIQTMHPSGCMESGFLL
jgi:hypothetical protein